MHPRLRLTILFCCTLAVTALMPATALARSSGPRLVAAGDAWGTMVLSGSTVVSGPTAYSTTDCGGTHNSNDVTSETVPGLLGTGVVTTDTTALKVNGRPAMRSTTDIANVNLLAGRITADAVKAVSTTSATRSGYTVSYTHLTLPTILRV